MFIAMNRFKIVLNKEEDFENIWKNRETHLDNVSGFIEFHLVKVNLRKLTHYMLLTVLGIQEKILKHGQNQKHFD